jgi:hypothetical protein
MKSKNYDIVKYLLSNQAKIYYIDRPKTDNSPLFQAIIFDHI